MLPISRPIQHGFLRVPGGLLAALAVIQAPLTLSSASSGIGM